ncbi:MAG: MmgE/PrpD family protein [Pseudomonadota bacterium]
MEKNDRPLSLEKRLVDHLYAVDYGDLSPDLVDLCKLFILDSLGTTIAGAKAPGCPEVVSLVRSWGGSPVSTIMVYGGKVAPPFAALANSMMMHALDFDDTLDASALHTFVTVLPAALSTAEYSGKTNGKRLITALVLGVDLICRLSLGIRRPLSWIRTATCGSFGAAATAAKILGLDRDGISDALGIVYSQTSGNAQGLVEGRLVKRMQPGFASQSGVISASLAQAGITGSRGFLEGAYGFFRLYEQGDYDAAAVIADLGEHYCIKDLSIKPYPACRMTHASIDAALRLREHMRVTHDGPHGIEKITVTVSKMVADMVGRPFVIGDNPQVDAQFSIPYTVSVALLRGEVFLEDFETEVIQDDQVISLAQNVEVMIDSSLPEKDILHSRMEIHGKEGGILEETVDCPLGNPGNPMDMDRCKEKFKRCLVYQGFDPHEPRVTEILSMVEGIENVGEIGELTALMEM